MMSAVLFALVVLYNAVDVHAVGCLNPQGQNVPWWVVSKAPDGHQFFYKDSSESSDSFLFAKNLLNGTTLNPLANTLNQIWANKEKLTYVVYNDEVPEGWKSKGSGGGHTKGVIGASGQGGFWLVHSLPKFPVLTGNSFSWGAASDTYGQSFFCMTLSRKDIENVGVQLMYNHPDIYDSNVDSATFPNLAAAVDDKKRLEGSHIVTLSAGSFSVVSFAKSNSWGKDLGEDLVSPYYQLPFMWETWRRHPLLPSYCTPDYTYDELNVNGISFPGTNIQFHYTKDHSKWGVANSNSNYISCIGDINRMESQRKRGGGTNCITYAPLYHALRNIISTTDSCSK
eukprot:TRINITY_DN13427_c0_g1_i1.p1 TRINITY_DN13427_c0_g1~~TRINITY_DN13427_c0_g1_i1.p1  ORF type:complete len:340 (+),score=63.40 TRINITY_DN13427_c0_g1_i1:52-1071(+)